jgi:hypothetical protein
MNYFFIMLIAFLMYPLLGTLVFFFIRKRYNWIGNRLDDLAATILFWPIMLVLLPDQDKANNDPKIDLRYERPKNEN